MSYPDTEIEIFCFSLSTADSFKLQICMLQFEQSPNKWWGGIFQKRGNRIYSYGEIQGKIE